MGVLILFAILACIEFQETAISPDTSCGPRTVFCFLVMHNIDVAYDEIDDKIPLIDGKGATGESLASCINSYGLESCWVHANVESLKNCPLPAIAHLQLSETHASVPGHYVVVVNVADSRVDVLDPLFGGKVGYSIRKFDQLWSGALLVTDPDESGRTWMFISLFGSAVVVASGLVIFLRKRAV